MLSLAPKHKPIVGLDISSSSIKAVELRPSGKRWRLHRCGFKPLPPGAVVDMVIKDVDLVVQSIRELFKEAKISTRDVATSISGASAIVKYIQLANMTELDLEDQISLEAEEYIPFDIADINLDFQILRQGGKNDDMMDVLLVACKKELLNNYVSTLEAAGLKATVFDMDMFCIGNAYETLLQPPGQNPNESIALINIGANLSNCCIVRQGYPIFTRDITFGGSLLTDEIQHRLALNQEEALQKQESWDFPPEHAEEFLNFFMDQAILNISHALDFYHNNNPEHPVQNIYLSGGCAQIPDFETHFTKRITIPSHIANPFIKLSDGKDSSICTRMGPRFMVAVGLALRGNG